MQVSHRFLYIPSVLLEVRDMVFRCTSVCLRVVGEEAGVRMDFQGVEDLLYTHCLGWPSLVREGRDVGYQSVFPIWPHI